MPKLAAIYVRVSSEAQGNKASPDEQEADCRKLAAEHGLEIAGVYRDIEAYRVGRKMVEPSGTRSDRPALVRMLNDAAGGQFDTILAWREDRLYRGLKSFIFVWEAIKQNNLNVILARENFDIKMAGIKASIAELELDGMRERMSMGVKARLKAGKANTGQDRYGYRRNGETIELFEDEAKWVRQVFTWYISGVAKQEIRRRLIDAGAPQKGASTPRRYHWAITSIDSILKGAYDYSFGIKKQSRDGEVFEMPIPAILDPQIYEQFLEVRKSNKTYPAHHMTYNYLLGGLLYCACGRKWAAKTHSYTKRNRKGEKITRRSIYGVYFCTQKLRDERSPDCPKTIGVKKADEIVWGKVCSLINSPEILMRETKRHIDELRTRLEGIDKETGRIQSDLDKVTLERQWVITQARQGKISLDDMEYQLSALTIQELNLKKELAGQKEVIRITDLHDWENRAKEYFEDIRVGIESLNVKPESEEEANEIFELKRKIVQSIVERVTINKERDLKVTFRLDVLGIDNDPEKQPDENLRKESGKTLGRTSKIMSNKQGGTYTHTPPPLVRRHPGVTAG